MSPRKEKRGVRTALKTAKLLPTYHRSLLQLAVKTYGPPELCVWRYGPRVCRFQTTSPVFARKLAQRIGTNLVGYAVSGGYLRIFQEAIAPWRARRLVERYIAAANGAFSAHGRRENAPQERDRVRIARASDCALESATGIENVRNCSIQTSLRARDRR